MSQPGAGGLRARVKEAGKRAVDLAWRLRCRTLRPACRVCGGSTAPRAGYGRLFLECRRCGFIFSGDYPEWVANLGMGLVGSWGGPDRGGEREDYLARLAVRELGARRILLYGVGSTLAFPLLLADGLDVCGCDVSVPVIRYRQREYGSERFFHARDVVHHPRAFDAVIACEVLEHFVDPRRWLGRLARALAPGGVLMGTTNFYLGGPIEDGLAIGYMSLLAHVAYWSDRSFGRAMGRYGMRALSFEMVRPGSVRPDPVHGQLAPNKRVFFATADPGRYARLEALRAEQPILPIDVFDYPDPRYRVAGEEAPPAEQVA